MFLLAIVVFFGIPLLAVAGRGQRSLYASAAAAAFVFAYAIISMANAGGADLRTLTAAERAGTAFMNRYFPLAGSWLVLVGVSSSIGFVVFRRPKYAGRV